MSTRPCPVCGSIIPRTSAFCEKCGSRIPVPRPVPTLGNYVLPRIQVDPVDSPYRDARWIQLVLGASALVVGAFLLGTDALVGSLDAGGTCGSGGCANGVLNDVLLWPGVLLVAVGAILVVFALVRTL